MEEEQTINTYELTLLIDPDLSEFDLNKLIDKVKTLIKSNEGNLIKEHSWGKKQLAYPINKQEFGFYHTLVFELSTENVALINQELQLNAQIIRHLNLCLNKEGINIDQLFTPEKEEAMISSSVREKMTTGTETKPPTTPLKPVKKVSPPVTKVEEKARKQELDKKIDDLLKTDDKES